MGIIHKAEYTHPGAFVAESTTVVLSARSADEARRVAPASAYCFTLYDVKEAPDLGPDFTVLPKPQNRSGRHYLGGTVHTLAEVERMGDDKRTLAANMRSNGWDRVVHCFVGGWWQPFESGDVLMEAVSR